MAFLKALAVGACLFASSALAQEATKETVISDASNAGWSFDGNPKLAEVAAEKLPGGRAILVTIPKPGANPWDIQARLPMKQGIAKGDTVTFGFYARAAEPDPGKSTAAVHVRVQRNAAPYDAALERSIEIGPDWTVHCVTGPASLDLEAEELVVSVQLAGAKHAIEVGPYLTTRIAAGGAEARSGLPCGQPPA